MTTETLFHTGASDAELVADSLTGDRDAFGRIVARYQSLVCSVAYSATGSLSQSEDLAQETFVAAWKQLASLREPAKLRSWLCRIARNHVSDALRAQGREPAHAAEPLDVADASPSADPLPHERAISQEEEAILWRSVERIPEIYREPLVLFYREHQSVERVAAALELSEDAVKQRLSRGRKLLHDEVLAFVEGALERTNPGKAFAIGVIAALPAMTLSTKAAVLGATAAKGSATAKAAATSGVWAALAAPFLVLFGNYVGYRMGVDEAETEEERAFLRLWFRKLLKLVAGIFVVFAAGAFWVSRNQPDHSLLFLLLFNGGVVIYLLTMLGFVMKMSRQRKQYYSRLLQRDHAGVFPKAAWEYRSRAELFGLPLVHIRIGDRFDFLRKPVKAWVAVGNYAVGGLLAFGGVAVAPVSVGFLTFGLVPFGGIAFGVLALGGFAAGVWSFGALAIGWESVGVCALAWKAAAGGLAAAHDFALGHIARAAVANQDGAKQFADSSRFFQFAFALGKHGLLLNLLWVVPLVVQWRLIVRSKRNANNGVRA